MKAVLLCPGPSLGDYLPQPADLLIGVNRAAIAHECSVWVCGDSPLIQQIHEQVKGSPLLVTSTDGFHVCESFKRNFGTILWRGEFRCWTDALQFCPHAYQWVMFSATAALVWCAFAGATRIEVFGADWNGVKDFDGVEAGKNRSTERWNLERQIWTNVSAWLSDRGVEVDRKSTGGERK